MPNFIFSTTKRFFKFVVKPDLKTNIAVSLRFKIGTLLVLLILNILFTNVWLLLYTQFIYDPILHAQSYDLLKYGFWGAIFIGCIVAPPIEELIFRFPMRYKRNYLFLLLSSIIKRVRGNENNHEQKAKRFYQRGFGLYFYLLTIAFACVHIPNFVNMKDLLLEMPFLVLSQFFGGLIMGFIRVRFGYLWGVLYHGLWNLIFISISLSCTTPLPTKEKAYTKIIEHTSKIIEHIPQNYDLPDTFSPKYAIFNKYKIDNTQFYVYIGKSNTPKKNSIDMYGITPNNIYFEKFPLGMALRLLIDNHSSYIRMNASDTLRLNIQFINKRKNGSTKSMLLEHLIKTLNLKLTNKKESLLFWEPVIKNASVYQEATKEYKIRDFKWKIKILNEFWQDVDIKQTKTGNFTNPNSVIFHENAKIMSDLAKELESYGVKFKRVKREVTLTYVE